MEKYNELKISVYLTKNINRKDVYEYLAKFINYSFNNSQVLSCLHNNVGFKHYSFSGLYPIESDGIYKSDEIYTFIIRSYKSDMIYEMGKQFNRLKNDDFVVMNIESIVINHKPINYTDNLTPTIITLKPNSKRWNKDNNNLDEAKKYLYVNMLKKYNDFNSMSLNIDINDVIKDIELKSKCGIVSMYKGIKFVGYKFRIYFKDNPIAQELAKISEVEGIGEKNSSMGAGFVKAYYRR